MFILLREWAGAGRQRIGMGSTMENRREIDEMDAKVLERPAGSARWGMRTWVAVIVLTGIHLGVGWGLAWLGVTMAAWWAVAIVLVWAAAGAVLQAMGYALAEADTATLDDRQAWTGYALCLMVLTAVPMAVTLNPVWNGQGAIAIGVIHAVLGVMGIALGFMGARAPRVFAHFAMCSGTVALGICFLSCASPGWLGALGWNVLWVIGLWGAWGPATSHIEKAEAGGAAAPPVRFLTTWLILWIPALFFLQGVLWKGLGMVLAGWEVYALMGLHLWIAEAGLMLKDKRSYDAVVGVGGRVARLVLAALVAGVLVLGVWGVTR